MCGLVGQYSRSQQLYDVGTLTDLTQMLRHRGPDDGAYWVSPNFYLGHRRLSIIDLSQNGRQPMLTADGALVVVFNGEIYNYVELRRELEGEGFSFQTNSDTEVLLHGYRRWGAELPKRLFGMFAFALADVKGRSLFLARDRFGEKPLFVRETKDGVVFSSELKSLSHLPDHDATIDLDCLSCYLSLNYVPGTGTLFESIKRVRPGTWRLYGPEGIRTGTFWTCRTLKQNGRVESNDALSELKSRVDEAVSMTLRSDVPVGLFLSGGIDSSIVAESAVRQGSLKRAFCLDFPERGYSELGNATVVAKRLNLALDRVLLSPAVLADFPSMVAHMDDPLADSSALPLWTISKAAARDFKVVISGDGGDELFAGYSTYKATLWHQAYLAKLPRGIRDGLAKLSMVLPVNDIKKVSTTYQLRRFLRAADLPSGLAHVTWNGTWLPNDVHKLIHPDISHAFLGNTLERFIAESGTPTEHPNLNDLQCLDLENYLPGDILTKVDRMAMAHGLEVRAPLLHPLVADFALSLPLHLRISRNGTSKSLLRAFANQLYGPQISRAKKQGFSIPIHHWLRDSARDLVEELLSKSVLQSLGFLDPEEVIRVKEEHLRGKPLGFELWGLMILVVWHQYHSSRQGLKGTQPKQCLYRLSASSRADTALRQGA